MGFDLDMTRGYNHNRTRNGRMGVKRQQMRSLYLKEIEARDYSYFCDTIPADVLDAIKRDIRKQYRNSQRKLWLKTIVVFAVGAAALSLVVYFALSAGV